jgi:GT2 family glycosyltransferase
MYRQPAIDLVVDREPGLAHARNTGISRARGALVAFIDDDAEASRDWLKRMLECFRDVQPQPWGIGGMVVPIYDSPKPQWFKDEYETDTWGDRRRFLTRRETFSGNNMAFVKKVIEASGGFELGAGMRGDRLSLGEETALLERIWRQRGEGRFYYCPEAVVFHRIGPHKMTVSYHLKRYFVAGQVWPVTHPPSAPDRVRRSIRSAASVLWHSATAAATMARYHCWQQWMVERLGPVAYELGRLLGCAGVVLQMRRGA